MKKRIIAVVFSMGIVLAALVGCSTLEQSKGGSTQVRSPRKTAGTVTGLLYKVQQEAGRWGDGSKAVAVPDYELVAIAPQGQRVQKNDAQMRTLTDSTGSFRFENVPLNVYYIIGVFVQPRGTNPPGYISFELSYTNDCKNLGILYQPDVTR